jgi:hypothetical protein
MPATVRHVWVQSPEHHQPPDPGLLLAWERIQGEWWAWVVTAMDRPGRSPTVIQRWYHRRDVTAAPTRPASPDQYRWHLGWKE